MTIEYCYHEHDDENIHGNGMAILNILEFPDQRLRIQARPIVAIDRKIRKLADDMLETMYDSSGIGLSATQVNRRLRLIVMDVSAPKNQPMVLINPTFTSSIDQMETEEGCLSVPGYYDKVTRAAQIEVTAKDIEGKLLKFTAEGLLGACIQHECDHLGGKLFIDYLSGLKRQRLKRKFQKLRRQTI